MGSAAGRWRARLARLLGKPSSDWMGPDPAQAAALRAGPIEADDRHEVVWFALGGERGQGARLAELGHRVFAISSGRASGSEAYELREISPRFFEVALPDAPLEGLDAMRRELSLGATACVVEDPARLALAERLEAEQNWPVARGFSQELARAFPKISIVVVTYNNRELNRLCLESLIARTEWPNREILVVDNGSTDGTPQLLEELAGRTRDLPVIAFTENRGYPAAVNAGLARATGDHVVLLNNDTVVTRGSTTALLRHLRRNPGVGLVGPVTNAIANEARIDVGYSGLDELPAWAARWTREHDGETFSIPTLAFFCVAIRREVLEAVGPLDERFGLGMFEDGDYNRRTRAAGWEILCARDSFVHHWQMASFRKLGKEEYLRVFEENRRKFEEKWGP